MNGFLKNIMYIAATALILAAPVLLTLSFCLSWDEAIQEALCVLCLIDFLAVLIFVTDFAEALE